MGGGGGGFGPFQGWRVLMPVELLFQGSVFVVLEGMPWSKE